MSKNKISIYATTYNNARVIKDSIMSIISQFDNFLEDFEFVVVDNYSNDGTYEILTEFSKKYNNFKVIQAKCTRGKGRTLAYANTSYKYVFTADLDTIYNNALSKLILTALKNYKEDTLIWFFCSRSTMDKIGPWLDSNSGEIFEFWARAISKNIKVFLLPVLFMKNEIIPNRERRYSKNTINYTLRMFNYFKGRIIGEGITSYKDIFSGSFTGKFLSFLAYLYIILSRKRVCKYSNYSLNTQYFWANVILLNPKDFGISEDKWGIEFYFNFLLVDIINNLISQLNKIGFDRIMFINKDVILFYHQRSSQDILKYFIDFYRTRHNKL